MPTRTCRRLKISLQISVCANSEHGEAANRKARAIVGDNDGGTAGTEVPAKTNPTAPTRTCRRLKISLQVAIGANSKGSKAADGQARAIVGDNDGGREGVGG